MSAFSNYLEDAIITWCFSGTSFPAALTTVYVSLHTADPADTGANEVTGGNYARIAVANASWTKTSAVATGTASAVNNVDITFPTSGTVTWSAPGGVTHVGIWSASTTGPFLYGGALSAPKVVASGDVFKFTSGNLTISVT